MASTELERLAPLLSNDAACAEEPIRIPGSIQPHGLLCVLEPDSLRLLQVSANLQAWLGIAPECWLGRAPGDWLEDGECLDRRLARLDRDGPPQHLGDLRLRGARQAEPFSCTAHRAAAGWVLEFEPLETQAMAEASLYPLVHSFVARLTTEAGIEQLSELAVREFKRLTGFGRVKVYRFDEQGNGQVLAEAREPDYPSYLGLHFPASDIPAQARALYLASRIRMIPDADYRPVPLVPALDPRDGQPTDLGLAMLRSVSPVHLQYMRNMGTAAALSVSLVVQGRLWGMISCHHRTPRRLGLHTRAACELLGRVLSLQFEAHEVHARTRRQLELRELIVRMLAAMAEQGGVAAGLAAEPEAFLAFGRASGGAVISGGDVRLVGDAPSERAVAALVQRLGSAALAGGAFHSDRLGDALPGLPGFERFPGVLAMPISELHAHYLLWFRPEVVRTLNWAGEPLKQVDTDGRLSPRRSFEAWQEIARGSAAPWEPVELESAEDLRSAVLGVVLRRAEELAGLADELARSNRELEAFSYSVSHDLRAPLRHIAGYAELLGDFDGDRLSERGQRFLGNIGDSARFAGALVDNLLSFSQMGRAALRHSDVDLGALVETIRREMAPDLGERHVEWRLGALPVVVADAAFIHLALRNLLSNALKYTRHREHAIIEVGARDDGERTEVFVRDNGVGFDMAYVGKLFGVFQRLHHMDEFEGTGIGLASVRRIIERHEGHVWAEGVPGEGATFHFSLPRRPHGALI